MDFTDLRVAYNLGSGSPISTLYIITTVFFAIGTITVFRFLKAPNGKSIYPQNLVLVAYGSGLIFRAISWGVAANPPSDVTTMFSSYDYPRLIFFTISDIAIRLLPIITVHYLLSGRNESILTSRGAGALVLFSYLWVIVILAVMVALAVVASLTPAPPAIDTGLNVNSYDSPIAFRALTDTYTMLNWFYIAMYTWLMAAHRQYLRHWSLYAYIALMFIAQIGTTIALFINLGPNNYTWIILQYVFAIQVVFPALLIATKFGSEWLPPIDAFMHNEQLPQGEEYIPMEPPAYVPPPRA
ncbi:hypothetical protein BC940DRAFT_291596 [Gongronella butleri]|nr:hypothetical protein BC940DRAFT_291596 [Gongronella butleri]